MEISDEGILELSRKLQSEVAKTCRPPDEGYQSESQSVIPFSIVRGTRGYIEKVANQVNGCYEKGWYDGCAVMIRRLVETLIIEAFEHHKIEKKIQNSQGNYFWLDDLIDRAINEQMWNLSRNTKRALPKLKNIGDLSAHSRRYNAHLKDIEPLISDVRVVVQEFIYLAALK